MYTLRLATLADIPEIQELIEQSVRGRSGNYYTQAQIESALRHVFGPDTQLIADQTYYVIETMEGEQSVNPDGFQLPRVSARTAYAVAASLINFPTSDAGSRCLFREYAGQEPAVLS